MAGLVSLFGVSTVPYSKFVDTLVDELTPTQPTIANAYTQIVTSITSIVVLFLLVFVVIVVVIMAVLLQYKLPGKHLASSIAIVFVAIGIAVVVWYSTFVAVKWQTYSLSEAVQLNTTDTVLYAVNSVIRDTFFVALGK